VAALPEATLVRIAANRIDVIGSADLPGTLFAGLEETDADAATLAAIALGRPEIPAALSERYVPQMLNLERLGAVSFTKGCYPGQEIVARTEHRGQVKRRLRRLAAGPGARPAAGDAVIDTAGETVGEVNRAAATRAGFELLAVVAVETETTGLRLAADGRPLEELALPRPS
jgi:folate-binding protein YgfZ